MKRSFCAGRHHLFGDRRGHDKGDVRIADGGHARGQGGFLDEYRTPIRRHGRFDRGLDVWMKLVEDGDSDQASISILRISLCFIDTTTG